MVESTSNNHQRSLHSSNEQLELKRAVKARAVQKETDKQQRKNDRADQLEKQCRDAVKALTTASNDPRKLNILQLKALILWKKNSNDGPLKTKKAELLVQFNQVKHRRENPYPVATASPPPAATVLLTAARAASRGSEASDDDDDSGDDENSPPMKTIIDDFDPNNSDCE